MSPQEQMTKRISQVAMARLDWRWSAGDISAYASIAPSAGDWGANVRVSDHRQMPGGGFNDGAGERGGEVGLDIWFDGARWHAFVGFTRSTGRTVTMADPLGGDELYDLLRELRSTHV